jgi:hypothetical protein
LGIVSPVLLLLLLPPFLDGTKPKLAMRRGIGRVERKEREIEGERERERERERGPSRQTMMMTIWLDEKLKCRESSRPMLIYCSSSRKFVFDVKAAASASRQNGGNI